MERTYRATMKLAGLLRDRAGFSISKKKLAVGGSRQALRVHLQRRLAGSLGKPSHGRGVKLLGASFSAGARGGRGTVIKARILKQKIRKPRLRALRRLTAQAARIGFTGVEPACLFGSTVTGVSDAELADVRTLAGAATASRAQGRSLTLALMLEDNARYDPIYRATLGPVGLGRRRRGPAGGRSGWT